MSGQIPKRPKPGEDEEELLRQMQNFEASKSSISSQNIKSFQKKKPSKFAQQRAAQKDKPIEKKEQDNTPLVLKSVVQERHYDYDQFMQSQPKQSTSAVPFPTVKKLSNFNAPSGKSLFAQQQVEEDERDCGGCCEIIRPLPASQQFQREWGEHSSLLNAEYKKSPVLSDKDKVDIHEGNVAILNARSDEQLKQDRDDLLKTMDPNLVEFLKKRRKKATKRKSESNEVTNVPPQKNPLHMANIEHEKMEWMDDIEPTTESSPKNFSARFDFKGDLLPFDDDKINVKEGLHHHGEEPNRPGYTLEELMTLSRSSNAQQASLAIQTLGSVIRNERHGRFVSCFGTNILIELLNADLISVLRIAMDNHHSDVILDASVQTLAEILSNDLEENALDFVFFQNTFNGYLQPSLYSKLAEDKDFQAESEELKDIQIMNADLILGLLRTNIVDRICYLLQVKKVSSATTIIGFFKILHRLARHSLSVASGLVQHEKLLKIITENFLPLRSVDSTSDDLYGTPVHYALKFMRLLMSWGRNIAKTLLSTYDLGPKILCYLSIEPDNHKLVQESLRLIVEAGRSWIVCLRYGLTTDLFMEYHPILMRHLVYLNNHLIMTDDEKASKFNYHFAVVILEVINAAIFCAPNDEEQFKCEDKNAVQLVDWSALISIFECIKISVQKWSVECSRLKCLTSFANDLLTSSLSLYSSFFRVQSKSNAFDQVTFLTELQALMDSITPLLFNSSSTKNMLKSTFEQTFFQWKSMHDGRSRDPPSLPSLGIIGIVDESAQVMIKDNSPFAHLATILELCIGAKKIKSDLIVKGLQEYLESEETQRYLKVVIDNHAGNFRGSKSNWFGRSEVNYLHNLIIALITFKPREVGSDIILRASLTLLTHYQTSDVSRTRLIIDEVIFHQDFIGESFLASILDKTSIQDNPILSQTENLQNLKDVYKKIIFKSTKDLEDTKMLWSKSPFSIPSLVLNNHGETLLPADWQYLPLLTVMSKHNEDRASDLDKEVIKSCLVWVRIMNQCIGIKSAVFCYSRLATAFLAASDLFLDPEINSLLKWSLKDIVSCKRSLVFKNSRLPGIDSFEDFYSELVQQYQAVSYGDPLFALMILIPITKGNNVKLSTNFWIDHMETLRSVTLKVEDLPTPLTIQHFIDHTEDKEILSAQVKAIAAKMITPTRNPLLFNIAEANIKASKNEEFIKIIENL